MEDEQIVELYLKRNEQAIQETAVKYGRGLQTLSRKVVGDAQTAEECVNDTYLKAWETIPPHEPRTYFFAFLARIVRCSSIDSLKKRNTQKRQANVVSLTKELDECVIGVDTTEDAIDEMLLKDSINSFLAGQTPEKRNVFVRRYFFADEIQDIVDRYGFSKSKVKMMLLRMRDDLKKHLIADGVW